MPLWLGYNSVGGVWDPREIYVLSVPLWLGYDSVGGVWDICLVCATVAGL